MAQPALHKTNSAAKAAYVSVEVSFPNSIELHNVHFHSRLKSILTPPCKVAIRINFSIKRDV